MIPALLPVSNHIRYDRYSIKAEKFIINNFSLKQFLTHDLWRNVFISPFSR